jgi:acetylornithine deacetylase
MAEVTDLLERLVARDTTSTRSNLGLLEDVERWLDAHEVPHERVPAPDGTRANLLARIGPEAPGGVVLSAHTDTVPVEGQPWSADPYRLREQDGRLYGRGTTDMKGFLAVVLAAVPRMVTASLTRPVFLALSYDEEIGTVGAPSLVDRLVRTQPRPAAVIVGEPTSMQVVDAHKGVRSFTTVVEGLDAHSSQPQRAANAVVAAARIAAFIDDLATEHLAAAADPRFDPPCTTFNVATVTGGQAINIVPRRCTLTWEYRPVPADDGDELARQVETYAAEVVLPRLRAATGQGAIVLRPDATVRALAADPDGVAARLARRWADDDGPLRTVAFGTDAGHFQAAGIPAVVCGPGTIDDAHQPDESIDVAQLDAAARFVDRLVDDLSTGGSPDGA